MRAQRRDSNESTILSPVEALGGFWMPRMVFDGFLWDRRSWQLVEIKAAHKEGWQDEFTPEQLRMMVKLRERGIPLNILRTESDVLALMGARRSA
jgi:hypothetical protein